VEITLLTPFVSLDLDHRGVCFEELNGGAVTGEDMRGQVRRSTFVGVDYIEAVGRGLVSTAASHDHKDR
jgi:hypothetical protein